ncbi:hypothetical protein HED60_12200 [Planctomycetales bacterium ZRK34]|nr:hypothetical protein HED60_12200 [Planctomycetales bacterium ZRK34]
MRRPSNQSEINHQSTGPLMEERAGDWRPDRISDRKLLELSSRLETIQKLGGAFANISFSPQLQQRLGALACKS